MIPMVSIWELEGIIQWACYGMEPPNMLRFGSEVRYRRWHGNYVRCIVKIDRVIHKGPSPGIFVPGRITAAVEFVGNTLRMNRCLILFSEFEAVDWAYWNTGVVAYKLRSPVTYGAYLELWDGTRQALSESFDISQKDIFKLARTALYHIPDSNTERQLRLFFENFYFLPRVRRDFAIYADIDKYDCLWAEDFPDLDDVPPPDLIMEEVDAQ